MNKRRRPGRERVNAEPRTYKGIKFDSTGECQFYKDYEYLTPRRIERKEKVFTVLIPRTWTPDFQIGRYYIEYKGVIDIEWKRMFEVFCKQNPEKLDFIILVFYSDSKFPRSKTTYVEWATNLGVHCCVQVLDDYQVKLLQQEIGHDTTTTRKAKGASRYHRRA